MHVVHEGGIEVTRAPVGSNSLSCVYTVEVINR